MFLYFPIFGAQLLVRSLKVLIALGDNGDLDISGNFILLRSLLSFGKMASALS